MTKQFAAGPWSKSATLGDRQMNPDNIIRIMTVDDHQLIREGIATVINNQPDMRQVSQASSGPEAIRQYREQRPDITLMDLRMPGRSGIAGSFSFAERAER